MSAATLRGVVDYLDAHADQPLGPTDIAEHADAPYRDIVEGLRRRDGHHPADLLWRARLRGVHRDLLAADPSTSVTIRETAAGWGFVDTETFAVAYTVAMGERPEDTLGR